MEIIIYLNEIYHLITVTKDMLTGLVVKKGMDLFEVCDVLRENYKGNGVFFGCTLS